MNINNLNIDRIIKNLEVLKKKQANNELIVQHKSYGEWKESLINDVNYDISNIRIITLYDAELRIKPEPQYRPYTEVKEEWIGKKVIPLNENTSRINTITDIDLTMNEVAVYSHWKTMYNMFENYIWGNNGDSNDGKPFGDVVE